MENINSSSTTTDESRRYTNIPDPTIPFHEWIKQQLSSVPKFVDNNPALFTNDLNHYIQENHNYLWSQFVQKLQLQSSQSININTRPSPYLQTNQWYTTDLPFFHNIEEGYLIKNILTKEYKNITELIHDLLILPLQPYEFLWQLLYSSSTTIPNCFQTSELFEQSFATLFHTTSIAATTNITSNPSTCSLSVLSNNIHQHHHSYNQVFEFLTFTKLGSVLFYHNQLSSSQYTKNNHNSILYTIYQSMVSQLDQLQVLLHQWINTNLLTSLSISSSTNSNTTTTTVKPEIDDTVIADHTNHSLRRSERVRNRHIKEKEEIRTNISHISKKEEILRNKQIDILNKYLDTIGK